MTLDYYDVMNADLSSLVDASEAWDKMGERFGELRTNYKQHVRGLTDSGSWTGVSAIAFEGSSNGTLHEFQGAKNQAIAIGKLLKDAHTTLNELKEGVKTARQEAIDAKMKVDAHGNCTYDFDKLTDDDAKLIRRDLRSQQETERYWTKHIADAVKKVADADEGTKRALKEATKDEDGKGESNGFNSKAMGDIEKYEAKHAAELGMKLNSGEELSKTQMADFQRLMRDNSDDKTYSRTLLNSLGADGTIKLTNRLNDHAYGADVKAKNQYLNIEKGLANSLATATRVPTFRDSNGNKVPLGSKIYQEKYSAWLLSKDGDFYKGWREEMQSEGVKGFDSSLIDSQGRHDQQTRGYQSLVTLMQKGGEYSPQVLFDLGDDIRSVEEENNDIWDLKGNFTESGDGWFANDPYDGILEIMSTNPDTATAYLDPETDPNPGDGKDENNDRLDYLLKDRDWEIHDSVEWGSNATHTVEEMEADNRKGLGAAIEAATRGEEPTSAFGEVGPHREDQVRVMQHVIETMDEGGAGDTIPENLRAPLGRALADYVPDTHAIVTGDGPGGRTGEQGIAGSGDNAHLTTSQDSTVRLLRGVSEDPDTFSLLYGTERAYAAEYMEGAKDVTAGAAEDNVTSWDIRARDVGRAEGTYNAIGADIILDERDSKVGWSNDVARYGYHIGGGALTGIPIVGDVAQRTVDAATYEWSKDIIAEHEQLARQEVSHNNAEGMDGTDLLLESWAKEHGYEGTNAVENAKDEAEQSYMTGRDAAYEALRTRK